MIIVKLRELLRSTRIDADRLCEGYEFSESSAQETGECAGGEGVVAVGGADQGDAAAQRGADLQYAYWWAGDDQRWVREEGHAESG
jgi:hypothetical protein